MKRLAAVIPLFVISLSGCELIGDIFKTGVWVGVIIVVALLALVGLLISFFRK